MTGKQKKRPKRARETREDQAKADRLDIKGKRLKRAQTCDSWPPSLTCFSFLLIVQL